CSAGAQGLLNPGATCSVNDDCSSGTCSGGTTGVCQVRNNNSDCGLCTAGNTAHGCVVNSDCDSTPGAGDGMCSPGTCVSDMNGVCTTTNGVCTARNESCDNDGQNCDPNTFPADPACTCNTQCGPCADVTIGDFIWSDTNHN